MTEDDLLGDRGSAVSSTDGARRGVFLDRDGTLIVDKEYMSDPDQLEWLADAPRALSKLQSAGFSLVVVTNQSGVARGYFNEAAVEATNRRLVEMMENQGLEPAGIYYCPNHPEAESREYSQDLSRRKPAPGMLFEAAGELEIELGRSYMVGDKLSDVEAGNRAGCSSVLVETGKDNQYDPGAIPAGRKAPDFVAADLLEAARWILEHSRD